MSNASPRILVIGAGMAGLAAARELRRHGASPLILDKGRAVGGRMATRRRGDARYDHGAQHFGARSGVFLREVTQWRESGLVHEWFRSRSNTQPSAAVESRHAAGGGMRRIPEHLAAGLDVTTAMTVESLELNSPGIAAVAGGSVVATAAAAIVTPPVPQTRALLASSTIALPADVTAMLDAAEYDACMAVMARLDAPSGLTDGHATPETGPVAWIADNQHKGVSAVPAVTIHSTPEFAALHLEDPPERWAAALVDHAGPFLSGRITEYYGHPWRYAQPRSTFDVGAVSTEGSIPVVLAGEIFAGARVEGAFTSGLAAAGMVLERL
jgi:predicted NAD/FAD-dependent oxidoreductase